MSLNKKDIYNEIPVSSLAIDVIGNVFVSALTGENTDKLLETLSGILHFSENNLHSEAIALTIRQYSSLQNTSEELSRLLEELDEGIYEEEIVALRLRGALDYIGEISGEIAGDEVLGKIFSNFCIGK